MDQRLVIKEFTGEFDFLSNFYPTPITFRSAGEDVMFPTAEHAFQAAKYKSMKSDHVARVDYVNSIAAASKPNDAKRLGQKVKIDVAAWEDMRIEVMREVVRQKFEQNDFFKGLLLATGPAMLVEGNTWGDEFWGRVNGKGYNMLGVILMELRGIYREASNVR